jgi:hypothetical protein
MDEHDVLCEVHIYMLVIEVNEYAAVVITAIIMLCKSLSTTF